ncbi:uncharacterized protein LOC126692545 [Quercus robur]|uniref:uncharacterized protein LOC126692545 n=1 Tax=Quercus robur TaxID=38942 RepID=UPI002163D98F|nr:uncharacterized protein LOC126692545 [Quercus robur]
MQTKPSQIQPILTLRARNDFYLSNMTLRYSTRNFESQRNTHGRRNREEKERRRRRKEGYWQQKFQGLLFAPSQIAEKGAWEGSFSQIAETQDFMLNLEEREEGEGERKVASDNELNFRYFNGCI